MLRVTKQRWPKFSAWNHPRSHQAAVQPCQLLHDPGLEQETPDAETCKPDLGMVWWCSGSAASLLMSPWIVCAVWHIHPKNPSMDCGDPEPARGYWEDNKHLEALYSCRYFVCHSLCHPKETRKLLQIPSHQTILAPLSVRRRIIPTCCHIYPHSPATWAHGVTS